MARCYRTKAGGGLLDQWQCTAIQVRVRRFERRDPGRGKTHLARKRCRASTQIDAAVQSARRAAADWAALSHFRARSFLDAFGRAAGRNVAVNCSR